MEWIFCNEKLHCNDLLFCSFVMGPEIRFVDVITKNTRLLIETAYIYMCMFFYLWIYMCVCVCEKYEMGIIQTYTFVLNTKCGGE